MPRATLASRQLKNKETGLDLFVPSYNEVKGMMTSTVHYQVVLVSNLACFKTPSHKESDVVQYSVEKKWNEFEELRIKITEAYPTTAVPPLNKKAIIVNDTVLRERRNSLDHLMKHMASVARLATSAPLLEFLGVDPARAKKFSLGESLEGTAAPSDEAQPEEGAEAEEPSVDFFNDDTNDPGEAESDLFGEDDTVGEEGMFGAGEDSVHVSMFEEQDMKRELTEDDEKDFGFIPDAIIKKTEKVTLVEEDDEDSSDLFQIEDDLDKLMTVDVGKKKKQPQEEQKSSSSSASSPAAATETATSTKPVLPSKPKPAMRPSIPSKPKPKDSNQPAQTVPSKPVPPSKPKPAPRSTGTGQKSKSENSSAVKPNVSGAASSASDTGSADNLGEDDIMKYLQENLSAHTEDVDLFS